MMQLLMTWTFFRIFQLFSCAIGGAAWSSTVAAPRPSRARRFGGHSTNKADRPRLPSTGFGGLGHCWVFQPSYLASSVGRRAGWAACSCACSVGRRAHQACSPASAPDRRSYMHQKRACPWHSAADTARNLTRRQRAHNDDMRQEWTSSTRQALQLECHHSRPSSAHMSCCTC